MNSNEEVKTKQRPIPRNKHLVKSWVNHYHGYWNFDLQNGDYCYYTKKEAWQLGYITWLDVHYSGSYGRVNQSEAWGEIFNRWVRMKKFATSSEVKLFLEQMKLRVKDCGKWFERYYPSSHRCGVVYDKQMRCWQKAPLVCGICREPDLKSGFFCYQHNRQFYKFCDKNNLTTWDEDSAEQFILNQMSKIVKQIEKGEIQWDYSNRKLKNCETWENKF